MGNRKGKRGFQRGGGNGKGRSDLRTWGRHADPKKARDEREPCPAATKGGMKCHSRSPRLEKKEGKIKKGRKLSLIRRKFISKKADSTRL